MLIIMHILFVFILSFYLVSCYTNIFLCISYGVSFSTPKVNYSLNSFFFFTKKLTRDNQNLVNNHKDDPLYSNSPKNQFRHFLFHKNRSRLLNSFHKDCFVCRAFPKQNNGARIHHLKERK